MKKQAVFLDRDGVINRKAAPHDYIKTPAELQLLPRVGEAIAEINQKFLAIVASNQRGIARGLMSRKDLEKINERLQALLAKRGAKIDAFYYCLHNLDDHCFCRKPQPGLILTAAREMGIDLSGSFMVGDSLSDIEAGKKAGCRTIFIVSGSQPAEERKEGLLLADFKAENLWEAKKIILGQ